MPQSKPQKTSVMLLTVSYLYFGFAFSQTTSTSTSISTGIKNSASTPWPLQTFVTQPDFHPPVFDITKLGETDTGYIFLDTDTNGVLDENLVVTIITDEGELLWSSGTTSTSDISLQTYDDEPVILYWEGTLSGVIGRGYGTVKIMDTSYHLLYNVSLTEGIFYPEGTLSSYIDQHEAQITSSNTLVVSAYNVTQADLTDVGYTKNSWILDSTIFEIDIETNEVLWSWAASDHTDQLPFTDSHYPIEEAPITDITWWDWFHINAIEEYGEGYLVSSRHLWSLIYISKATGEVIWTLNGGTGGNFTLPTAAEFKWQHDSRVLTSSDAGLTVTLFNNNNFEYGILTDVNLTTGLQIALNTEAWTATVLQIYYDSGDTLATVAEGSYQTTSGGHVLLDYGLIPSMIEFDADGTPVWVASWGSTGDGSYRGLRYDFTGTPDTLPDLVVKEHLNGTFSAYMSWNGATEYTHWELVGCGVSGVTLVERTGFETSFNTQDCSTTVVAKALGPSGTVLGTSAAVKPSLTLLS